MAGNNDKDIMNINDPLDINELAALNDDISIDFIEQLQNQISQNSNFIENKPDSPDVTTLFEEVATEAESSETTTAAPEEETVEKKEEENKEENFVPQLDNSIDDNFIKKYKAKIEKQKNKQFEKEEELEKKEKKKEEKTTQDKAPTADKPVVNTEPIETLTNGNIVEKPATQKEIEYNESLDLMDDSINYSKYVIYIDPENTEFIESLTVKERKNLINKILKEQDNIVITKKRLNAIQTYIKHAIIAILTIAIATPIVYYTINASLEATINNHRRSQTIFKTLYKEKGKIKTNKH